MCRRFNAYHALLFPPPQRYIGILMSSIVSYVEAFGWETMPCFVHMFATVLFPPFFLAPLSVGAFCHFKESRIHAKMAKHANDINVTNRTTRDKEMFTKLVNDLKTERKNLRGVSGGARGGERSELSLKGFGVGANVASNVGSFAWPFRAHSSY